MSITTTVTAMILANTFSFSGGNGIYSYFRISASLVSTVLVLPIYSISVEIMSGAARSTFAGLRESWNFLYDEAAR